MIPMHESLVLLFIFRERRRRRGRGFAMSPREISQGGHPDRPLLGALRTTAARRPTIAICPIRERMGERESAGICTCASGESPAIAIRLFHDAVIAARRQRTQTRTGD